MYIYLRTINTSAFKRYKTEYPNNVESLYYFDSSVDSGVGFDLGMLSVKSIFILVLFVPWYFGDIADVDDYNAAIKLKVWS